jgi:hypothetical protein
MAIQTFPFLEVNTLFNEGIDLGNVGRADANWQAKLTQYAY